MKAKPNDPIFIYECSNPECGVLWRENPNGHCPKCIKPDGGGWSTICRSVAPLPAKSPSA